jgi:hypothetical protein
MLQAAQYGTWFAGGTVALVIVNVILRGMKKCMPAISPRLSAFPERFFSFPALWICPWNRLPTTD